MIHQWKKALLEGAAGIFERGGKAAATAEKAAVELAAAEAAHSAAEAAYCPEEGEILDPTQIIDGADNGAEEGEVARAAGGPALA